MVLLMKTKEVTLYLLTELQNVKALFNNKVQNMDFKNDLLNIKLQQCRVGN